MTDEIFVCVQEDVPVKPLVASKNGTVGKPAAKAKDASTSSSEESDSESEDEVSAMYLQSLFFVQVALHFSTSFYHDD